MTCASQRRYGMPGNLTLRLLPCDFPCPQVLVSIVGVSDETTLHNLQKHGILDTLPSSLPNDLKAEASK